MEIDAKAVLTIIGLLGACSYDAGNEDWTDRGEITVMCYCEDGNCRFSVDQNWLQGETTGNEKGKLAPIK